MNQEADLIREEVLKLALIRVILMNFEVSAHTAGYRAISGQCGILESHLAGIEDALGAIAHRLDPVQDGMTGKETIKLWKDLY